MGSETFLVKDVIDIIEVYIQNLDEPFDASDPTLSALTDAINSLMPFQINLDKLDVKELPTIAGLTFGLGALLGYLLTMQDNKPLLSLTTLKGYTLGNMMAARHVLLNIASRTNVVT